MQTYRCARLNENCAIATLPSPARKYKRVAIQRRLPPPALLLACGWHAQWVMPQRGCMEAVLRREAREGTGNLGAD